MVEGGDKLLVAREQARLAASDCRTRSAEHQVSARRGDLVKDDRVAVLLGRHKCHSYPPSMPLGQDGFAAQATEREACGVVWPASGAIRPTKMALIA
jgi:hypothetical protein